MLEAIFNHLFIPVMAEPAEALQIVPPPEQPLVAPVRFDVIDHLRLGPKEGAAGVQARELGSQIFPSPRIAAPEAVQVLLGVAALPLTLASALTGEEDISPNNSTA